MFRRVLYNLPLILKSNSQFVWIVEGEKDADNLKKCGFVSTCNVGGAGKWLDGYTDSLKGKEVILCGDNDAAGRKHVGMVLESICKHVKTVRRIEVPSPRKDVSDFIASFHDYESAARELFALFESAVVLTQGVAVPVQTITEIEADYKRHVELCKTSTIQLDRWIPSFRSTVRGLVPGELVTVLAATAVGKTVCLQNIAIAAAPIPTLVFELELPSTLIFERFVSSASQSFLNPGLQRLQRRKLRQLERHTQARSHRLLLPLPPLPF